MYSTRPKSPAISCKALAERWGVPIKKIHALIDAGELVALNVALNPHGAKPRYRITETEIEAFEDRRRSQPKQVPIRSRRRRKAAVGITEYF
jgi:hypothetical protein